MASCVQTAPFPYFGGKRVLAATVWRAFGTPKHYIEPFCGSAAVLLAAPTPASLEVIGDRNGFIANFWRAVVHDWEAVAHAADYPVSHVDLGARHRWLLSQRGRLSDSLADPFWPGDPQIAGWWLWGQCCWIGSGWCDWLGQIPHASSAGRGVQALGQIPHASSAGRGAFWTSGGRTAARWLYGLAQRLERVRVVHGEWTRCLNRHYGGPDTAIFLDPPYANHGDVYSVSTQASASAAAAAWARDNGHCARIALCGLEGEHEMPGWTVLRWSRGKFTYAGSATTDRECVWFSPTCEPIEDEQLTLFSMAD